MGIQKRGVTGFVDSTCIDDHRIGERSSNECGQSEMAFAQENDFFAREPCAQMIRDDLDVRSEVLDGGAIVGVKIIFELPIGWQLFGDCLIGPHQFPSRAEMQ